jgi:hypothetical protein
MEGRKKKKPRRGRGFFGSFGGTMMGREAHHWVAIPPFCRGWIGRVVSWLKHLKGHFLLSGGLGVVFVL